MNPAAIGSQVTGYLDAITDWLASASTTHPFIPAVAALIAALIFVRLVSTRRGTPKDPTRMFSANQRVEGFARAGGRCELEGWWFFRCKQPAHHGDHHYPHSKGGATSMANFTAACARCNTSKGAKIPGFFATLRLEARRRRYFPPGIPVKAGDRFVQR